MTIKFYDVSNNNYPPYFPPSGPTIAKACEGAGFTDAYFTQNRDLTLAGGWPFIGYEFLRGDQDVAAQVAHTKAVVGAGTPVMLDIEVAGDNDTWPTYSQTWQFITMHGKVTLGYLPEWFWRDYWGSPDLTSMFGASRKLISSNYTTYSDSGPGWNSYGGVVPTIWQFTDTPIDTNAFKGTMAQLAAVFAGGSTPPPVLRPEGQIMRYVFDPASYQNDPGFPPDLLDPKGNQVVVATDNMGHYFVQEVSWQMNGSIDKASGTPIVLLTKGNATTAATMPPGWPFAQAFAQVTGGAVYHGKNGTAQGGSAPVVFPTYLATPQASE